MARKLDFYKAYDTVQWDFVEAMLLKMGFNKIWVQQDMQCISMIRFSVVINGEARVQLNPRRGLRQGDPLSPYIFVLVKDVLSKMISKASRDNKLFGIKFNYYCPRLSHILFADDVLFLKAEVQNCSAIKDILTKYGETLGQRINFDKYSFLCKYE